jgi:hypothetical protein
VGSLSRLTIRRHAGQVVVVWTTTSGHCVFRLGGVAWVIKHFALGRTHQGIASSVQPSVVSTACSTELERGGPRMDGWACILGAASLVDSVRVRAFLLLGGESRINSDGRTVIVEANRHTWAHCSLVNCSRIGPSSVAVLVEVTPRALGREHVHPLQLLRAANAGADMVLRCCCRQTAHAAVPSDWVQHPLTAFFGGALSDRAVTPPRDTLSRTGSTTMHLGSGTT